jgi:hypothetical protein
MTNAQNVTKAKNVVLVNGLYADGSSWLDVIGNLQSDGLNATAVRNPPLSPDEGAATTRRVLALQEESSVERATTPSFQLWSTGPLARPTQARTLGRSRRGFRNPREHGSRKGR